MVKAKFKTKWGTLITIDGMLEEVDEIISNVQRREAIIAERYNHPRPRIIPYSHPDLEEVSPKEEIEKLIKEGFLNDFKTLPEIRKRIYSNIEKTIPNSSLHPSLMLFIRKKQLYREKQENGLWGYKAITPTVQERLNQE